MDDSLKDNHYPDEQLGDNSPHFRNQAIFVTNVDGEIRLQLDGSHTTTSETESSQLPRGDRCVKFEQLQKVSPKTSSLTMTNDGGSECCFTANKQLPPEQMKGSHEAAGVNTRQLDKQSEDIGVRFKQIMDMFDTFTKNLEMLELQSSVALLGVADKINIRHAVNKETLHPIPGNTNDTFEMETYSRYDSPATKRPNILLAEDANDCQECKAEQNSISTTTSGLDLNFQNAPCENEAIGPASATASAGSTSRSEMRQSLNNYANADYALRISAPAEGHPLKLICPTKPDPSHIAPVVAEEPCSVPFHTIHIDTTSTPSSSDLRRPPLCQRMWDVITDFCAAVCLCLQVNKDCIFCLGFFAAFVVSASFLTAFFYRTLSVSPPLWQYPPHPIIQDG